MKKRCLLFVYCMILILCKAQYPIAECQNEEEYIYNSNKHDDVLYDSRNGNVLSPHGDLRVLVIFAEIEYDIHPENDPNPNNTDNWHVGELPVWKNQLFDANIPSGQCYGTVTQYFNEASFGNYYVLGDYLINPQNTNGVFKIKESDGYTYTSATGNIAETILFNKINQLMTNGIITANGYNNINYFDKWTTSAPGEAKITPSIDDPHKFDCVVVIWRNRMRNGKSMNNTGHSNSNNINLLGYGTDFFIDIGTFSKIPTTIIRHEYAHGLLGGNNFHTAGGGKETDYFIQHTGGWSMLGLSGSSLQCCNAWDRYRLGWTNSGCTYEIAAHDSNNNSYVNGDLNAMEITNDRIFYLRDFITYGDAIRIKLPFIDSISEYNEYIWLENHSGKLYNNSDYDLWQYEEYDCVDNFVGGLMAYIQIDKNTRSSNIQNEVYGGFGDYTRPITANGYYDRIFEENSLFNNCVQWGYSHAFIKFQPNPLSGGGDEENYAFDKNHDDLLKYEDRRENFIEKINNSYYYNLIELGNNAHVFRYDGIKKIGIGTNPSTATIINMVGLDYPNNNVKNLRTTYLNGISIEIIEHDNNGNIKVRIRFDDVDVDNDVRWCSDSIVLNEIPTSSGYSLNLKAGNTISLDQGLTATRMSNPLTFNGQNIFASPTTFTIQPNAKIHIDTSAKISLENSSKLHFRDNSVCVIEDNGCIEVKSGTIFQLDKCATLIIKGTGKLIVRSGGELRISNNANLGFENGSQNLVMENNVIISSDYTNPLDIMLPVIGNSQINSNTTWNDYNMIIDGLITINNNATLNLNSSTLRFLNKKCGIVINKGSKLIINGSTLTNICSDEKNMWQGIEVWGDSNADQLSHHGTYNQGYLEMKNGATIENAVCAVELWHPNYWGTTGGIIHATDAIFRNNAKAVHALNYVDHNLNGNEIAYNSQFTKCSFIIDENYLGTETFSKHVDLFNVNSVYFAGCHFSVKPQASGVSPYCIGIGAYGAGFLVESYCEEPNMHPSCPENDMVRSSFEGFNNGILSINENSQARSFTVRDASFINNNRGVFMQNTGYATIVRSDFRIGGNSSCGYGVYADGVTGFRIEENSFSPSQGILCPTYGIGIFNSRGVNDVYLNTFNQLTCGNIAYGVNNTADVLSEKPSASMPGLTYSCNDNTGNDIDFCVLKDNGTGGIASPQGSATVPAGNTFSGSNYHFYNGGDYEVKYFCNLSGINEIPDPNKMQYVDSDAITYTNDCASHYGNGGVVRSAEEKAALAAIYQSSGDAHERMTAAGDIVRSCLNEDATDATELRQWLGNMHELESDRMAVASYIQEGDFTNAQALASSLPSTYNLQGDDLSDHNDYMTLLGMYQTLHNSNRTIHEMTSSEKATVKDMAENGLGASQQMARAILMTISDRYIEPYICPEMPINSNRGTKSDNDNANTPSNDSELSVTVAPIPATTWVSVDYKLPCDTGTATMSVFNSLGVKVMEVELDGPQGTKTFDLQGMPDGVYSYIVRCGEYQNTGKLIITL